MEFIVIVIIYIVTFILGYKIGKLDYKEKKENTIYSGEIYKRDD